ncbi:MAG: hypothetical protein JKY65_01585 [Planctomycetes bacterium]|nr:hypothetical protein [Planctomycetota bacterium]
MKSRLIRAFTLMELMVVIGIIMIMTAISIPAISKFMDGQKLQQSGRLMQSSFNEARRAAITQRAKNVLVFFREEDAGRPGFFRWGTRRYRERVGYDSEPQYLLAGAQFELETGTIVGGGGAPPGHPIVGRLAGLPIPVFDGIPDEANTALFGVQRRPTQPPPGSSWLWVEFQRDGTINTNSIDNLPTTEGFYDLNIPLTFTPADFDALMTVPNKQFDICLRESGDHQVDKRCFMNLDPNTGRLRLRVHQINAE